MELIHMWHPSSYGLNRKVESYFWRRSSHQILQHTTHMIGHETMIDFLFYYRYLILLLPCLDLVLGANEGCPIAAKVPLAVISIAVLIAAAPTTFCIHRRKGRHNHLMHHYILEKQTYHGKVFDIVVHLLPRRRFI